MYLFIKNLLWKLFRLFFTNFVHSIGVKVSEVKVEKKIAPIIVTANSSNNLAVSPFKKIIGRKTLTKTTDVDTMAKKTSFEPSIAA